MRNGEKIRQKIVQKMEEEQAARLNALQKSLEDGDIMAENKLNETVTEINDLVFQREELYNEIWNSSMNKVSKKYGIPYLKLKKACELANIPVQTKSYWGNAAVGKKVEKTPLPDSDESVVTICLSNKKERSQNHPKTIIEKRYKKTECVNDKQLRDNERQKNNSATIVNEVLENFCHREKLWGGILYERDTLYKEVWSYPIIVVARTYGVSDVMIHKICKKLDVPTPPAGYWAKKKAGKSVEVIPLPGKHEFNIYPIGGQPQKDENGNDVLITGKFADFLITDKADEDDGLAFLSQEEYSQLINTAKELMVSKNSQKYHPILIKHKHDFAEWGKTHHRDEYASWNKDSYRRVPDDEPAFWNSVSEKTLSRVYVILDALYSAVESLGGEINDDLSFVIRNEIVPFTITEGKTIAPHMLTENEIKQLNEYEQDKRYSWSRPPQIRKNDHIPNGSLTFCVNKAERFRDTSNNTLEMRLGEILLALYRESENVRSVRQAWEEKKRKAEEEARQQELLKQRKRNEIERLHALENEAEDYDKACKIRAYIAAVQADPVLSQEKKEWIQWAKQKADWIDPIISARDPFLGIRDHKENDSEKQPRLEYWDW